MRIAWISDPHLVFVTPSSKLPEDELTPFLESLAGASCDALAISGDISESPQLLDHLRKLEQYVARPVFFVLGNHDYYHGSFVGTQHEVATLVAGSRHLCWLEQCGSIQLTDDTAIIGHGCWGDARYGELEGSRLVLNDWKVIEDLRYWKRGPHRLAGLKGIDVSAIDWLKCRLTHEDVDWEPLVQHLRFLGDEAAAHLRRVLPLALKDSTRVILVTHVPPFVPTPAPRGHDSASWAPHAGCKAVGDAILEIMEPHPHARLLILSGHVHYNSVATIRGNIEQRTAWAEYGEPCVSDFIHVGGQS
jgi:3',5'-cyclic-AMP phosphodiesterase